MTIVNCRKSSSDLIKKQIFILFFVFSLPSAFCQNIVDVNDRIMEIARSISSDESDAELEELYYRLLHIYNNPININTADISELSQISFLNEFQVFSIVEQRKKSGALLSIFELSYIGGFDKETCLLLNDFVVFGSSVETVRKKVKGDLFLLADYDFKKRESSGLPIKLRIKSKISADKYTFGFTAESDKNEYFFKSPNNLGFDFYSGYIQRDFNNSVFKKIIVGDYHIAIGQGLNLWTPYSFGKGNSAVNISRKSDGIKKYSSSDENRFLRGVAVSLKKWKINSDIFLSYRNLDASLDENQNQNVVQSFLLDGIHSTTSQIENKDRVGELLFGINSFLSLSNIKLGLSAYNAKYYNALLTDFNQNLSDNMFGFSAYFNAWFKKFNFSGEFATDKNISIATIVTANYKVFDNFILASFYRYYSPDYWSRFSSAIAENSENRNEKGFYIGAQYLVGANWTLNLYTDFFNFSTEQYQINRPANGNEFLVYIEGNKFLGGKLFIKYKAEEKEKLFDDGESNINPQFSYNKRQAIVRYRVSLSDKIQYQFCTGHSFYSFSTIENSYGMFVYNELFYKRDLYSFSARLTLFDIPDWENRLYTYEYAPLYVFSSALNYGQGAKFYFNCSTSIFKNIEIWAKFSHTINIESDFVGNNVYNKNSLILQARYKF